MKTKLLDRSDNEDARGTATQKSGGLFYFSNNMIYKILRIDDEKTGNSLTCFVNDKSRVVLAQPEDNEKGFPAFIVTMSKEEAIELSNELKKLSNSL